jgi:hypothetical protein
MVSNPLDEERKFADVIRRKVYYHHTYINLFIFVEIGSRGSRRIVAHSKRMLLLLCIFALLFAIEY